MSSDLQVAVTAIIEHLLVRVAEDRELRSSLRQLATVILAATENEPTETTRATLQQDGADRDAGNDIAATTMLRGEAILGESPSASLSAQVETANAPTQRPEKLPELTLGRARPVEPSRPQYIASNESATDFATIEARCRLKAEATRWAASRRRLMAEGASFETVVDPKDRDMIARAKNISNCFLWMCHPSGPAPTNLALYEEVAGCFEALAEAAALMSQIQSQPEFDQTAFTDVLDLLAEAQSALRVAISNIEGPVDPDQVEVFRWLNQTGRELRIFIKRFMRIDDPADPAGWTNILARIEAVEQRLEATARSRNQRKKLLGKVRHKTTLILNEPEKADEQWPILIDTVRELVSGGLPPSNRELREFLIPVIESLPESAELPREFELVMREIDNFLATCPPPESRTVVKVSPEVQAVAKLLRGRALVLIGGEKRQTAYQAIREAFELEELIWIETRAHESFEGFGPYVARPEVAAVLLAIRWSSHSYGEVKNFCEQHDKPLIRLPGGYNPNQLAAQIIAQASDRLR
jgi:hypothetical protein